MLNRNKKATILICLVIISIYSINKEIPKTESYDPFFTLVAKCFTPTQMDIMFLIKQQIARVGINLDVIKVDMPDGDTTKIRDYDLTIMEFNNQTIVDFEQYLIDDPFFADFYSENGSINVSGYDTGLDWDEELGTGKNEWYIQTGLQMTPNNSQERINHCWEWQNYLMDEILPCLPIYTSTANNISWHSYLIFNMRQSRPILGSRAPCPEYPYASIGLALRKAISYAINREEIKRVVLGDEYEIYNHPINPLNRSWLNPNPVKYCFDLVAAKDFMTTMGYSPPYIPGRHTYIGYGRWPDWEDVCSNNIMTSVYGGMEFSSSFTLLTILSSLLLLYHLKTQKKKTRKKKSK